MNLTRHPISVPTRAPDGRTNAYILGSDPALLIDPADRTPELDRLVETRGVEHILVTHTHPDHVGGVAAYASAAGATTWARRGYEQRFERATGIEPDRVLEGRHRLYGFDGRLECLAMPGHAPDHVAIHDRSTGAVVVGDCAVASGSVVVGTPDGDMRAYLTSLRRLLAMKPNTLYPAHGLVIDEPRAVLERLLAHRLERERKVAAAVESGAGDTEMILERAYETDLEGVRDLAEATVEAHLEKLAVEGRIKWEPADDHVRPV